jgi:hypothetical protein
MRFSPGRKLMLMFETTGKVTEVCKFSQMDDQITIEATMPCSAGEKAEVRSLDWAVPAGTVKVGATLRLAFIE